MKRLFSIALTTALFLILSISTFAQSNHVARLTAAEIPSETIKSFETSYPDGKLIQWWRIDKNYQAEFSLERKTQKVLFNDEGSILEKRRKLDWPDELPKKVVKGFKKTEYKFWKVEEAYQSESTGEDLFYEIKVTKDDRFQMIYFKPSGDIDTKSMSTY
jgi:hypothetical protein